MPSGQQVTSRGGVIPKGSCCGVPGGSEVTVAARAAALEAIGARERERTAVDLDEDEYLGTYASALMEVELKRDDEKLLLVITPKGGFPKKDSPPMPAPPPEIRPEREPDKKPSRPAAPAR